MRKYTSGYEGKKNIPDSYYNSHFEGVLIMIMQRVERVKLTSKQGLQYVKIELDSLVKDKLVTQDYADRKFAE
ncbi:hypothetical protein, partial [Streptomyces mirabilis]